MNGDVRSENRPKIWLIELTLVSSNFAFLQELEDLSELRELSNFEGNIDAATSEEVNCFWAVEEVADVGSLNGNHLDDGR